METIEGLLGSGEGCGEVMESCRGDVATVVYTASMEAV
jgi:hypothetical protein